MYINIENLQLLKVYVTISCNLKHVNLHWKNKERDLILQALQNTGLTAYYYYLVSCMTQNFL